MQIRFILAISAQAAAYLFLLTWLLLLVGLLSIEGPITVGAVGALVLFGCITPLLLDCEQCGVSYFWDPRSAERHAGGMRLKSGYNLLKPVSARCRKCGLSRLA